MNKLEKARLEIREMDDLAAGNSPVHGMTPLSKLFVTVLYIVTVVSFHKYDITGLFAAVLIPFIGYQIASVPVRTCFRKLRHVLPLVAFVGLLNPLFDKSIQMVIGNMRVSGGVLSMLTLMMKGVFCLMASFLLAATTSIEEICAGLRKLHVPKILTSLLLLTFRYVGLLLSEAADMTEAYSLRAPGQKGVRVEAWGSFLGQLLLRSMDRAEELYNSMLLRGYNGEFYYAKKREYGRYSWPAALITAACTVLMRFVNVPAWISHVIGGF